MTGMEPEFHCRLFRRTLHDARKASSLREDAGLMSPYSRQNRLPDPAVFQKHSTSTCLNFRHLS